MSKGITNFPYHINNVMEQVSAKDLNVLSKGINNTEKNVMELYDLTFEQKAFDALQNSISTNSMFLDDLKTPYKIFMANSVNIKHDADQSCIAIVDNGNVTEGVFQTTKLSSKYTTNISDIVLLVDDDIPKGCRINYFVSADGVSFFPVKPNTGVATKIPVPGNAMFVKAQMFKNKNYESPRIFGWALLYSDPVVERMSSIKEIDFSQIDSSVMGDTVLVRDKSKGDRIIAIIGPDNMTELTYDDANDMRLSKVTERDDDKIISETLNYGPYENVQGETVTVLLGTTRTLESGSLDEGGLF